MADIASKNTKAKKQKRKTPFLGFNIRCINDFETLTNSFELQKHVFDNMVDAVSFGIDNNKVVVDIFKIFGTDKILSLHKNEWKTTVQKAMWFYSSIKVQDYDKAIACRNIISEL